MKEEEFKKKVINKLDGIDKRLKNMEEKLNNIENAMISISEDVEDEDDYEGDDTSTPEPEGNNITGILPSHKNIKGYI